MEPKLYKMTGAGNDFVVLDGRGIDASPFREVPRIQQLCAAWHTDGLMILGPGEEGLDFSMEFFNPDGSGGMMCGNGGRCITAFADYLGLVPASGVCTFRAPDGLHRSVILERDPDRWTIRLKMIDVEGVLPVHNGWFLNTGTRHLVRFVPDVDKVDIGREGPLFRWDAAFAPVGTNVNFVQVAPDGLHIRTFEKGVEGETLACGTGITASAIAAFVAGIAPASAPSEGTALAASPSGTVSYRLQCRRGDWLSVDFQPGAGDTFRDVWLTGPAEFCD